MYHSLGSSKPNLKRKICKNFLNQPENKKSKEVVKELDEDDFLLSQVNLDEIELKATQVQAQQEQVFIPERLIISFYHFKCFLISFNLVYNTTFFSLLSLNI